MRLVVEGLPGVELVPARPLADRDRESLTALLEPPGTEGRVFSSQAAATETGWPVKLIVVRVTAGGSLLEVRLVALYRIFDDEAAAIVRWPAPGADAETVAETTRHLLRARPTFEDELPALADLFEPR